MYLTPLEVQQKLILIGVYTAETVPSIEQITYLLEGIEQRLDIWLGYHPAKKTYIEKYRSTNAGTVILLNYPVIIVNKVEIFNDYNPMAPPTVILQEYSANWMQGTVLKIGYPNASALVTYEAGYDPLPDKFKRAAFEVFRKSLAKTGLTGDLSFLEEPIRDVSSISVPGISKSFRLGKSGSDDNELDRMLSTFNSERRRYRLPSV